jgi:malate dehydrogenase (oxaloacetate-decarboxylating)(NADP+)
VRILDARGVDFEYEGDMSADVALDHALMKRLYPFARLSGDANVLVMPTLHSANISAKLLGKMAAGSVVGPRLVGLEKPVQIVPMGAVVSEIVNMAALAAHDSLT